MGDENWHKDLNNEACTNYMYDEQGMSQSADGVFSGTSSINRGYALGDSPSRGG
jgi:hypothetical protein